jgi:hypothetical protein
MRGVVMGSAILLRTWRRDELLRNDVAAALRSSEGIPRNDKVVSCIPTMCDYKPRPQNRSE